MNNKAFSDWFDSYPNGEPSYQETFEAGQAAALAQPEQSDAEVVELQVRLATAIQHRDGFRRQLEELRHEMDELETQYSDLEKKIKAPEQSEPQLTGCACRWDTEDNRVATCVRHQGWLDVVQEWAERAKAAEAAPPLRELSNGEVIDIAKRCNILDDTELLDSNQWRQDTLRELQAFARAVLAAARSKTP